MITRLMFLRALVGVVRVPVFAGALALLIGTVAVSGAGILIREGLRAWATFWTGGTRGLELRTTGDEASDRSDLGVPLGTRPTGLLRLDRAERARGHAD